MAATDARPVPQYGAAFRVYFALRYLDGRLDTGWINPSGFISKDNGAFANVTTNPVEIGGRGCGYCDLSSTEMTADGVVLILQDSKAIMGASPNSGIPLVLTFYPEQVGDYRIATPSGAIADAVWNQPTARNVYANTFGKALSDASGNTIAAVIGNSIWNETVAGNIIAGTFGDALNQASGTILRQGATGAGLTSIPTIANVATVANLTNMPSGAIAQAVWDRQVSTSRAVGTFGDALNQASGTILRQGPTGAGLTAIPTIANVTTVANLTNFPSGAVADAVWNENLLDHLTSDSAGDWLYISATRNVDPWDEDLTTYGTGTAAYQIYTAITETSGVILNGTIDANIVSVNGLPVDESATIDANVVQVSGVNITLSDFNTGGTGGDSAATIWAYANRTLTSFPSGAFAEAVWNEQVAGNVYAGTFGDALNIASGTILRQGATGAGLTAIPTIANVTTVANLTNFPSGAIADAVWDEIITTHNYNASAGHAIMIASGVLNNIIRADMVKFSGEWVAPTNAVPANITQVSGQLIHIADFNRPTTGSISSSTFAANAITSTAIAADAIGSSQLATTAVDEIVDQVWNEALSTHLTAGTTGDALNQASGTVLRQGPTGAGLSAIPTIAAVTTVTNLTNAPTAGDFTATMKSSIGTAVWTTPATRTITGGTVDNLTNLPSGAIADAVWDEQINTHQVFGTAGRALMAASGDAKLAPASITTATFAAGAIDANAIATDAIGANEFSQAAADKVWNTTVKTVTNLTNFPSGAIADAVWDEPIGQHRVETSAGYALIAASGNLIGAGASGSFTPADIWSYGSRTLTGTVNANIVTILGETPELIGPSGIADAVWDEVVADHQWPGSAGQTLSLASGNWYGGFIPTATQIRQEIDANSIQLISLSGIVGAVKVKTDYLPSVNPGSTGGLFRVGQNSPIAIVGTGDALAIVSTGNNGNGAYIVGNGTGAGISVYSTNGIGLDITSNLSTAVKFNGNNGYGFHVVGNTFDIFTISNAGSWDGNSTHTAADVWNEATRTLTSFPSGAIADAVWDEQKAGHNIAGTMGDALNQASGTVLRQGATGAGLTAIPTIANVTTVANLTNFPSGAIADAVWDEILSQHQIIGTTGYALNTASGNLIGVPSALTAADVWAYSTRQLTSFPSGAFADAIWDEVLSGHTTAGTAGQAINDILVDTNEIQGDVNSLITDIGADGAGLTAIPWNAAWDAQVESEVNDALVAYDAVTGSELITVSGLIVARTLPSASYFDPATDTVVNVTTVANITNLPSGAIADAVWDEVLSQHQIIGTTGYALNTASGNLIGMVSAAPSAASIADAVWDEALSTHLTAGTTGDALNQASGTVLRQGPTGAGLSAIPTINTVTNLTNAPTNGDFTATMKTSIGTAVWTTPATRTITGGTVDNLTNLASGAIADAVWDEALSQHQVLGTTGYALNTASGNLIGGTTLTAAQVWAYSPRTLTGIVDANIVQVSGQAAGAAGIIPANVIQVSGVYVTLADFGGDSAAEIWTSPSRTLTSIPSGAIAEAVWNEQVTGNIYAGTFGDALNTASGILLRQGATGAGLTAIPTVANVTTVANLTNFPSGAVADAVWDEQINTHNVFGTAGRALTAASGNDFIGVHASPTNITAGTITTTLNLTNFPSGAIADLVWDEVLGQHQVVGSTGYALNVASGNLIGMVSPAPTAAAIADAVWDEQMTGHNAAGSMGDALNIASGNFIGGAGTAPSADTVATAVWNKTVNGLTAAGSFGDALNQASGLLMNTAYGLSAIKTQVAAIEVDTQDLQTQIGVDGAGLTNMPWNASWDAQVQSEVEDGLLAYNAVKQTDLITVSGMIVARTLPSANYFDPTTDTVANVTTVANITNLPSGAIADAVWDEVLSQHQVIGTTGYALNTASGNLIGVSAGLTAADVWSYTTRQLTSFPSGAFADAIWDEILSGHTVAGTAGQAINDILVDTNEIQGDVNSLITDIGTDGAGLTAIPWNAAWDAEVQSEVTDALVASGIARTIDLQPAAAAALTAYDPPTYAELVARTLDSASYFDPAADTVVNVTNVANITNFPSGAIADAVWDEQVATHSVFGSAGRALTAASGNVFAGVLATPTNITAGTITNLTNFPSGAIADAVWDEAISQHQSIGTTGYALNTASGNLIGGTTLTAAQVWTYADRQLTSFPSGAFADAVWDEVLGQHQTIGTAGYALNTASGNLIGGTTLTAAQVWTYTDRQLTSYPSGAFADAIWDEVLGGHQTIGTAGYALNVASGNLIGSTGGSLSGIVDANIVSISGVKVNIDSQSVADSQELSTLGDLLLRRARIIRLIP